MKIHNAFVQPGTGGPRKMCDLCHVYYQWIGQSFRCPKCGASTNDSEEIIDSTKKILKADVAQPIIRSKKTVEKDRLKPDLPKGAQLIRDDQY